MVIAPFNLTQGVVEPYISLNEFKYSATASAIDFSNLVANGNQAAQDRSLTELIIRASSKIDSYCLGRLGSLNATSNTGNGRYRMDRKGRFKVHPDFTPVLEVTDFSWGAIMGNLNSVPVTVNNCFIERDEIIIQAFGAAQINAVAGMQAFSYITGQPYDGEFYCEWTYVNGWANTFTTASSNAGDTNLLIISPTGFYPGMNFTIWDGMNDEYCQVNESYDGVSLTLPLVNPLNYKHGTKTNLSTLPAVVKQACIHFVIAMIKQRGQGGIVLDEQGGGVAVSGKVEDSAADEMAGLDLLDEFKQVYGRL